MMNVVKKPETFEDLLQLQKRLDEEVGKPRENGFVPRERTFEDTRFSLDDEFNEWLKEMPYELNFKTWKEKDYSREKEIEEITDCLFFFLQIVNQYTYRHENFENDFEEFREDKKIAPLKFLIVAFKEYLFSLDGVYESFGYWIDICRLRGFTKQEILDTYWSKWQKNMNRIKGDWTK